MFWNASGAHPAAHGKLLSSRCKPTESTTTTVRAARRHANLIFWSTPLCFQVPASERPLQCETFSTRQCFRTCPDLILCDVLTARMPSHGQWDAATK
jgi:hypothetical protein